MLQELSVHNYALIDALELQLPEGFSTLTGETGAGKSIILGALGHILGSRAQLDALRDPTRKCIIEASFGLPAQRFQSFFEERDLDYEHPTLIRREIAPSGKSRAFINDTPVRLDTLKELAPSLIDVHSQHENLLLQNTAFQLNLLDNFAENQPSLKAYQKEYKRYRELLTEQDQLRKAAGGPEVDVDYLQYLYDELAEAKLESGEQEKLETELERLEHAGEIQDRLSEAFQLANDEEYGASSAVQRMYQAIRSVVAYAPELKDLSERLESLTIEVEDLRQELETKNEEGAYDPGEKERLDQRLSKILHLQQKHQVSSVEELLEKQQAIEEKIQQYGTQEERRREIAELLETQEGSVQDAAIKLRKTREGVVEGLSKEINGLLKSLNLAQARLAISLYPQEQWSEHGADRLEFTFSANPGQSLRPLHKIASGGELSRVMLALKAVMARTKSLPTIIFDEIDTGVSGETAQKVASILAEMGEDMQVLSITHLPQIAARSQAQFKVYKETLKDEAQTRLQRLDPEERLQEVARLLSGENPSPAALANARELLGTRS